MHLVDLVVLDYQVDLLVQQTLMDLQCPLLLAVQANLQGLGFLLDQLDLRLQWPQVVHSVQVDQLDLLIQPVRYHHVIQLDQVVLPLLADPLDLMFLLGREFQSRQLVQMAQMVQHRL